MDPRDAIGEYLKKSDFLTEIEPISNSIKIAPEEDVWIIQCPKNISIKQLKGEKLKFPGKTNLDDIEIISELFPHCRANALALRPGKVRLLPIQGKMIIREKMKPIKVERIGDVTIKPKKTVPFPEGLVERHPLLGMDYTEKITLREDVKERLAHCHEISSVRKVKSEIVEIKNEYDSEVQLPAIIKKERKKKRKMSGSETDQAKKKKKVKKEQPEEISADLSWINNI